MSSPESIGDNSFRDVIVRMMIERKYKKVMVSHYWNLPEYKKEYKYQTMKAAKLIKIYSKKAILTAIEKEKWCYSLGNNSLITVINEEQQKIDRELANKAATEKPVETVKIDPVSPSFRRKKKEDFKDG